MTGHYSYDLIAEVYATDMGRSMPFDDVGWYAQVAASRGGRTLELGCGTGRITIELAARGIDIVGVDRSQPMLVQAKRDAARRGVDLPLARMDMRHAALRGHASHGPFATILLPYSLVTYLVDPAAAVATLRGLRELLEPGGAIVLDAFVPRPIEGFSDFRRDYRREHDAGFLEREKRIAVGHDGTNVIERRYRLVDADGAVAREFVTRDHIRPYPPAELEGLATAAGFSIVERAHDYAHCSDPARAQFHSIVATKEGRA